MIPIPPKPGKVNAYYVSNEISHNNIIIGEGETVFVEECKPTPELCLVTGTHGVCELPLNRVKSTDFELISNPVHEAAKRGNVQLLESCLQHGMSVNSLDKSGSTPLYWASLNGHLNVVERLLQCEKVDVSSQNKMGDTALHSAARKGYLKTCESLVKAGAPLNVANNDGKTPLDLSLNPEISSFIKLSLEKIPPEDHIKEYQSSDEEET
ncbi:unnamed protein product [Bursaphelenchus xylophilus]|uniref:(pine wood nematode) hypothetical protein n=1 Tax=Bursaphelenchus xylophilus TaxID=6326 RepID=A0A1I7SDQ5_BURXY|nr:unnamed protein product [Bursaphelenchus xylophilus]CAG9084427.1 unnamed protein product [Bursaphelenchus xylophilus]